MNVSISKQLVLKIGVGVFIFLVLANILFLDYSLFFRTEKTQIATRTDTSLFHVVNFNTAKLTPSVAPDQLQTQTYDSCYPNSCIDLIRQATASANQPTPPPTTTGTHEYFIPLGTGQTTNDQYEVINGVQATIDTSLYGKITSAKLEVTMHIPTGNGRVYAMLYNSNSKSGLLPTEIFVEGDAPKLVISSPFQIDSGVVTYSIQMKSTLKYQAILDQARIHIITE